MDSICKIDLIAKIAGWIWVVKVKSHSNEMFPDQCEVPEVGYHLN